MQKRKRKRIEAEEKQEAKRSVPDEEPAAKKTVLDEKSHGIKGKANLPFDTVSLQGACQAKQSNAIPSGENSSSPQAGAKNLIHLEDESTGPSSAVVPRGNGEKGTGESSAMQLSTEDRSSMQKGDQSPDTLQEMQQSMADEDSKNRTDQSSVSLQEKEDDSEAAKNVSN